MGTIKIKRIATQQLPGHTLLEVLVSTVLILICLSLFIVLMDQLYRSKNGVKDLRYIMGNSEINPFDHEKINGYSDTTTGNDALFLYSTEQLFDK